MKNYAIISTSICLIAMGIICLTMVYNNRPEPLPETSYVFNIVDDSIVVYHNDLSYVGTVKLEGQLDSLLVDDNM